MEENVLLSHDGVIYLANISTLLKKKKGKKRKENMSMPLEHTDLETPQGKGYKYIIKQNSIDKKRKEKKKRVWITN